MRRYIEDPANEEYEPKQSCKKKQKKRNAYKPSIEEIKEHFHLPLDQAAPALDICETKLKKLCREYGIKRWPYRTIKSESKQETEIEQHKHIKYDHSPERVPSVSGQQQVTSSSSAIGQAPQQGPLAFPSYRTTYLTNPDNLSRSWSMEHEKMLHELEARRPEPTPPTRPIESFFVRSFPTSYNGGVEKIDKQRRMRNELAPANHAYQQAAPDSVQKLCNDQNMNNCYYSEPFPNSTQLPYQQPQPPQQSQQQPHVAWDHNQAILPPVPEHAFARMDRLPSIRDLFGHSFMQVTQPETKY